MKAPSFRFWSELIHSFSPLLFLTIVWKETNFSRIQSAWMDFFSSLALCEVRQLDDLFCECKLSTGVLFQLSLAQRQFGFRQIDPERRVSHFLMNCLKTLFATSNHHFLFCLKYFIHGSITEIFANWAEKKKKRQPPRRDLRFSSIATLTLDSFTFSTWSVPACHIYFISPNS